MQQQAEPHTGQRPQGDDHEKFEASPHGTLAGVAGFDRTQHQGDQCREAIRPPSGLWQSEQHRQRWDEATHHKGDPNLHTFQPRIDAGAFDDSQLVMHHGPVPAFPVGRPVPNHAVEQGAYCNCAAYLLTEPCLGNPDCWH